MRPTRSSTFVLLALFTVVASAACRPMGPWKLKEPPTAAVGTASTLLASALGVGDMTVLEALEVPVVGVPPFTSIVIGRYQHARLCRSS